MSSEREILGNYDIRLVTGFDATRASRFLRAYGKPVGGSYFIKRERFQELLRNGEVENFRHIERNLSVQEFDLREKFARTLASCLEAKNITQNRLCALLNISTSQIQGYLNREYLPGVYTLYRIAAFFGKTMNEMIGDEMNDRGKQT